MINRRRKIIFIAHQSNMYGASHCLLALVVGLDAERYEKHVVCPEEGPFVEKCRKAGVQITIINKFPPMDGQNPPSFLIKLFYRLTYFYKLTRFLHRFTPDLAYVNTLLSSSAVMACKMLGVPVITHVHEYKWRLSQLNPIRVWLVLYGSDRLIAVSQAVREMLLERGVQSSKVAVVYNGFPLENWTSDEVALNLREQWKTDRDEIVLGVIGSIEPHKGLITLVEAISIIQAQGVPFKLIVVGDVPKRARADYFESVRLMVKELGLAEQVIFAGFQADVVPWVKAFDIVVIPSLEESFGRVAVEAMIAGKPVVATNVGALPEIVLDGQTGLLVEPGSPEALASAISKLVISPDWREELGLAGRRRAMNMFALNRYIAQIEEVIATALDISCGELHASVGKC